MKNESRPYSPHVLARWQWVIWPFILLQSIGPLSTWIVNLFYQQPPVFFSPQLLIYLQIVGSLGLCVWFAWCQPVVWAYDPLSVKKIASGHISAKRLAWWLNIAPQVAPFFPFLFAVGMAVLVVIDFAGREWTEHVAGLFVSLVALFIFLRISRRVHEVVLREFPRRISMLGLCFDCGYNVSATQGTDCPECGRPIPRVEAAPASN